VNFCEAAYEMPGGPVLNSPRAVWFSRFIQQAARLCLFRALRFVRRATLRIIFAILIARASPVATLRGER